MGITRSERDYQHQMLSLLRSQRNFRGSVAWGGARTIPMVHASFRLQSSATSPVSSEVWSMLQEERKLSRELQANLRAKDEDLRSKDEDLRSKDEDLRSKDKELSELHPLVVQFKFQQHELLRYKNIVSCRGALELVAAQKGLPNASDMKGWRNEFGGTLAPVLKSCNLTEKVLKDNRGRPHDPSSLTEKLLAIWRRLCCDLHPGGQFHSEGTKVVLRANGLSDSDVLVLQILFSSCGIDTEIRPRVDSFDGTVGGSTTT